LDGEKVLRRKKIEKGEKWMRIEYDLPEEVDDQL
jgi:hypothetical protein